MNKRIQQDAKAEFLVTESVETPKKRIAIIVLSAISLIAIYSGIIALVANS